MGCISHIMLILYEYNAKPLPVFSGFEEPRDQWLKRIAKISIT
jgi:hypothetical protein